MRSNGTPACSSPDRSRTVNVPASRSRSPTTTTYGAFISCAARIFFPTVSFVSSIVHPETRRPRLGGELLAVRDMPVGHRDEPDLLRREPQGERATVVLDQHRAEPLEAPEDRAVDHHRPMSLVVVARVLHVEALGKREVALHGGELPEAADRVAEVEVHLRAVERALPLGDAVVEAALLERLRQGLGRARRGGLVHDRLSHGERGELDEGIGEAERPMDLERQLEDAEDLVDQLVRGADDVRVVHRETADPEQAVEGPGLLVAVDVPSSDNRMGRSR